jgi:hypothetical protein
MLSDHADNLFHVLLVEVDKDSARAVSSSVFAGQAPIRVDFVARRIRRQIAIGEADRYGRWGIAHEFTASRLRWQAVRIRMHPSKQFIVPFLEQSRRRRCTHSAAGIEPMAQLGGLFVENITIHRPRKESAKRMPIQTSNLEKRTRCKLAQNNTFCIHTASIYPDTI